MKNPAGRKTSLVYLERNGRYLVPHRTKKDHDENHDKWIGLGGKFKPGETPDACALREVREESGLSMTGFALRGLVIFVSDVRGLEYMYLLRHEVPLRGRTARFTTSASSRSKGCTKVRSSAARPSGLRFPAKTRN